MCTLTCVRVSRLVLQSPFQGAPGVEAPGSFGQRGTHQVRGASWSPGPPACPPAGFTCVVPASRRSRADSTANRIFQKHQVVIPEAGCLTHCGFLFALLGTTPRKATGLHREDLGGEVLERTWTEARANGPARCHLEAGPPSSRHPRPVSRRCLPSNTWPVTPRETLSQNHTLRWS